MIETLGLDDIIMLYHTTTIMSTHQRKSEKKGNNFSIKFCILFALAIFCFLSLFSSGVIESEDGWLYLNVARNIYYKHEIIATPQTDYPTNNVNMNSMKGPDGKWRAPGSTGYSFAMVPAVALSDLFHRYYHSPPENFFPLNSDWSLLFFASFTNIFFASILALIMLEFGISLGFSKKQSLALSLVTIFCTNLFPMAKFGFPQMMFTCFLMLTFLFIKKFSQTRKIAYLASAFISFFVLAISYNIMYYLTIAPLVVYLIVLQGPKEGLKYIRAIVATIIVFCIIKFRFVVALIPALFLPPKVVFEGLWGFLFSSGKSIFLYSPILLILPVFWHTINKTIYLELIGFGMLAVSLLIMISGAWI